MPALIEALQQDRWPEVRQAAANALGDVAEPGGPAMPVLYEAMRDPDGHVQVAVRNALFRVDPGSNQKAADALDEIRAEPPEPGISTELYEDVSGLPEALAAELPVVAEVSIYPDSAIITAPEPTSPSDWGRFRYEKGVLGGPREGRMNCEKTFQVDDVDLTSEAGHRSGRILFVLPRGVAPFVVIRLSQPGRPRSPTGR